MQATITTLGHGDIGGTYWHCVNLQWPEPRGGSNAIRILSVHVPNVTAQKVAGMRVVAATLDAALAQCPEIDLVTGGSNGARLAGMCMCVVADEETSNEFPRSTRRRRYP